MPPPQLDMPTHAHIHIHLHIHLHIHIHLYIHIHIHLHLQKLTEYYLGNIAASAPPTAAEGEPGRGGATGEVKVGHQEKGKEVRSVQITSSMIV